MHASKRLSLLHALLRVASISDYLFLIHLVILLNALGPRRVVKPKSYTFPFLSPGAFSLVYTRRLRTRNKCTCGLINQRTNCAIYSGASLAHRTHDLQGQLQLHGQDTACGSICDIPRCNPKLHIDFGPSSFMLSGAIHAQITH
ncbi:hypothetical protein IG631_13995 [Alternaria alternata]|nr:hypothetical protein IG631_13995 [Alternaria alternata]